MDFWELIDYWKFIGGLGLFLLAMSIVESSLIDLSGRSFKKFLIEYTKTPLRGVLTGTATTSILQSSSVVTLMVLSFVGAGLIEMRSALGVIFGSNLGTTFTGWIVATIGFKIDLNLLAYPLIGIGSLLHSLISKESKWSHFFKFLAGLGLLFLGLDFMKLAMASVSQNFNVSELIDFGTLRYFVFGFVFTAIIQSSSATMMITLSALNADIISIHGAAALIIGADLGTTITTLLGGIGGSREKKQTSLAHFIFNFVTDIIALVLIKPLLLFINYILGSQEPLISLVLFHSMFNFLGILLFLPFTKPFANLLDKYFGPVEKTFTKYIQKVNPQMSEAAIEALNKEIFLLIDDVMSCNLQAFLIKDIPKSFKETYEQLKEKLSEVFSYTLVLQEQPVQKEIAKRLGQHLKSLDYFSRSIKSAKDIHHNLIYFENSADSTIVKTQESYNKNLEQIYTSIKSITQLENEHSIIEKIIELKSINNRQYEVNMNEIYNYFKTQKLSESNLASLLNINREIYSSTETLLLGIKEVMLSADQAVEV
ncbi:MAG: Na/Pi symporter [Bdellovibrionales bacterium]|nr:Na/Pi symporter [Bdellovibrionales bacterium]